MRLAIRIIIAALALASAGVAGAGERPGLHQTVYVSPASSRAVAWHRRSDRPDLAWLYVDGRLVGCLGERGTWWQWDEAAGRFREPESILPGTP